MMKDRICVQLPASEGFLFWKLNGSETLSEPFSLSLTLLNVNARINRSKLLGQPATVTIPTQNSTTPRYFNGRVTRAGVSPVELSGTRYAAYTLTLEPDVWPMKRDKNMRIFQGRTAPDIVKSLLNEYRVNVDDRLTENYRVWDYCVQYQESSLDFIHRLMEHEGISYHFRHEADRHVLVLTDSGTQFLTFPGYGVIPYYQTPSGGTADEEGIGQWAMEDCITPGLCSLDDYDFRKPYAWLFQARQNPLSPQPGDIDVYEWPARFMESGDGELYSRRRQERWQVEHQQIHGTGNTGGIVPGHMFSLANAPFPEDNGEYLVTGAEYQFEENPYSSGNGGEAVSRTDFAVIPSSTPYRPAQKTPWPRTYGPQTARVVCPPGESIWTDKYGRVKVKFHWDRESRGDDTSSCWVRVSSAWAGQGFGGVQIPRGGDEVVVDFINGDPDRPIITGRVYNEASMPPWDLPAAATQMGFMTRSKDGGKDNASYLFFEDKPGCEAVEMHSEKDMMVSVENDKTVIVDGNRNTTIKKEQDDDVIGNAKFHYHANRNTIIGGVQDDDVTGEAKFHFHAERTTTVDGKETGNFNNGESTTIKNGRTLDITSGGDTVTIVGEKQTDITGSERHHVTEKVTQDFDDGLKTTIAAGGKDQTISAGGKKETIDGGVDITVNSGDWVQKVNGGTITIESPNTINIISKTGINLEAPKAFFNPKLHNLSITAFNESVTGNNVSLSGMSSSVALMTNSAALASSSFKLKDWSKTLFKAQSSSVTINMEMTKITNSITNITNNALFIIT